ncbi:cryptochrome/photolyase family protein [Roseiconus lacunae]|uniref:Cryptochrome/photolyase family protein n=1 Tax=Roseiconus lacunae TaxID=2605694 RepID=A0ABT7PJY8_9BACT|nr:cryptochrome/photolyase family protein [Roseiconus lacunae]MDM4016799.1 cryptochrome/photolyase family protein [Roseiconus lacunae]
MILLIFPHQLFWPHPGLRRSPNRVLLIEDSLFFGDARYPAKFHKQKLWLHRTTMRRFENRFQSEGHKVEYIGYEGPERSLLDQLTSVLESDAIRGETLVAVDPVDFIAERRLRKACEKLEMTLELIPSPGFINSAEENQEYRDGKSRWFMADFYKWQRKRLDILVDSDGEPEGGQWSFDDENRKKIPKSLLDQIPELSTVDHDPIANDVAESIENDFASNPGRLDQLYYPTTHTEAERWLDEFLTERLDNFGPYEDAIEPRQSWLWHSVLTPALNIGLLTPNDIVRKTLSIAKKQGTPLNSTEGFIRQVIGWREFMRATYEDLGVRMRTNNHWGHHRPMPECFYDGTTTVDPVDDTIKRLLQTGYCHHIERLMVLGGFMFLCELEPQEIYTWFMELFIDSYDWVMVPNVYAMSQHADGGLITTKPYFSGSSYIRKMSHYKTGPWCDIWDGLYWRWIWNHREELGKNPRWAMMCKMAEKMDDDKMNRHRETAEEFLSKLDR